MPRWPDPNPEFFIVLNGPFSSHDPDTSEIERLEQEQFVGAVQQIIVGTLRDEGLLDEQTIEVESYLIPPAAEGFAHLFDLTAAARTLTDDAMRAAFIGGAIWKAVQAFRRWKDRRFFRHLNNRGDILLSSAAVRIICEYYVRSAYGIKGQLTTESLVFQPWTDGLGDAGINPGEKHIVWVVDENGITYQFITDSSASILKHYIIGGAHTPFLETDLPELHDAITIDIASGAMPYDPLSNFESLVSECLETADRLLMNEDKLWLQMELAGYSMPTYSNIVMQRFERATLFMPRDPIDPEYRLVWSASDPLEVTITEPPIDTTGGHTYRGQVFIISPIQELHAMDVLAGDTTPEETHALAISVSASIFPELSEIDLLEVFVPLSEVRRCVTGFRHALNDFLKRSYVLAHSRDGETPKSS